MLSSLFFFAYQLLVRGLLILLSHLIFRWTSLVPIYFFVLPYERAVIASCWGITNMSIYHAALLPIVGEDVNEVIWTSCHTLFATMLALAARDVIHNLSELHTFSGIQEQVHDIIRKEGLLAELEGRGFGGGMALIDAVTISKRRSVLPDSKSHAVKKMDTLMDEHQLTTTEAAGNIVKEIFFKGDREVYEEEELKSIFSSLSKAAFESKVLGFLDTDKDRKLNQTDIRTALLLTWKDRKQAVSWMKSRRLMLDVSDKILTFLFYITVIFIVLSIFVNHFHPIEWNTVLVSLGTLLIALSFAYGKVLQNLFDSLYLIFLVKPFEVGDIIRVGDSPEELIVDAVGVMSTYFIKKTTGYGVYISNALLASSKLSNYNRGDVITLVIPFQIAMHVTKRNMKALKEKVSAFLLSHRDVYLDGWFLFLLESVHRKQKLFNGSLTVKLQKWLRHQDVEWREAQSSLILFLNRLLFEMGLEVKNYENNKIEREQKVAVEPPQGQYFDKF